MAKVEDVSTTNLIRVRGRWDYARKKLRRIGVVEVNNSHPHHDLLFAIKEGLSKILIEHPCCAKDELSDQEFEDVLAVHIVSPSGKKYTFESYASPVFACLRGAVDISEEDYVQSLAPPQLPYLEFISNSRSGADFYFSNNQRFILKTDKEPNIQHFLSTLRGYLDHFHTFPHSLLVKFLGVYSIQEIGKTSKRYFLVMQSIFYPTMRIEDRYDLKGSMVNRYQNPNPSGKKTIVVLKDKNFKAETIELGSQKEWFETQLRADTDYLMSLGVIDYSLLLGRHPLQSSEKRESVKNLLLRMKRSFGHDGKTGPLVDEVDDDDDADSEEPVNVHSDDKDVKQTADANDMELKPVSSNNKGKKQSTTPSKIRKYGFLRSLSDKKYLDSTKRIFHNRRLLLNCENNLHIIDGVNCKYFVGIIDFFTVFGCRERVVRRLKDVKSCCGSHSTIHPDEYGNRFFNSISEKLV